MICGGLLTRLPTANHHKPPPKRRKYEGFGTMGIPAIRERIVLHRQGLATLKEPNYLLLSQILAVVCSGLRWFACFPLFSLPIGTSGDLWWFAVICGRLWSFAMVCGGLSYSYRRPIVIVIPTSYSKLWLGLRPLCWPGTLTDCHWHW